MFPDFQRDLKRGEEDAVAELLRAGFGGDDEVRLVDALRASGAMAGESVLPMGDKIVGYFALSRMQAPKGWLCVAPVVVAPECHGRRFGLRMMKVLTDWATRAGITLVVLGEPDFYERCGFERSRASGLTSPYPISHTMLGGAETPAGDGRLVYPKAFGGV